MTIIHSRLDFVNKTIYIFYMAPDIGFDYDPDAYPPFAVTVDVAVFTVRGDELQVLLIERGNEPYLGALALPGGFVRPDEDLDQAAARELAEETGLRAGSWHLEQLASYGISGPGPAHASGHRRLLGDLRRTARTAGRRGRPTAALLMPVREIESGSVRLAFDHERIVRDAVERTRSKLEYTALAAKFCPPEFTIGQLRRVYEAVWNTRLDPGNFQRNVQESGAFEKRADAAAAPRLQRGRPAALWSVSDRTFSNPPLGAPLERPPARRVRARRAKARSQAAQEWFG